MKILILCTGNSCRSQMAEAFLKSFDKTLLVFSAGTKPAENVSPYAIKVMQEIGLDISKNKTKNVDEFLSQEFDYVITVCDDAKESCPVFIGKVQNRLHFGFEDPAKARGTESQILEVFRKVRNQIKEEFLKFDAKINMKSEELKALVQEKYSEIAKQSKKQNESSCCGASGCCSGVDYTVFSEKYDTIKGYNPDADLGLGCGLPTEFAQIKTGDIVVDLGSGAGNDCFVARALVGETGEIIGIDFTQAMIDKARENAKKLNYSNVEFRYGDIEKMPVTTNKADVIISNCVLNLVPNKTKAFNEIYRVLKPGGHLSVSDVVLKGILPEKLNQAAQMYAGCVSGAIQMEQYLQIMKEAGLKNILIQKQKVISLPDEILSGYLTNEEIETYKKSGVGVFSITVYAEKPICTCSNC